MDQIDGSTQINFLSILIPALSAIIASLLTFLATNKSSKRESKTKIDSLYIENIMKMLETYQEEIKSLKAEIETYSNENHKLRETVVELQKENQKLQDLSTEVIKKNNQLIESNEDLKTENIKMQRSLEELKKLLFSNNINPNNI